jgi:hypothetical protein
MKGEKSDKFPVRIIRLAPHVLAGPKFRLELNSVNQIGSFKLRPHAFNDVGQMP